jgi:energy-coupling factor transport system ATP-binding protein
VTEIRLEALVHVYPGGVRAVDGVDLEIGPGERVALVGQNGSGKSTLVRHLNGLLRPTSGRVLVDGADAARQTVARLAHSVGLAFQDPESQIFAPTVRAEVEFGPRNLGLRGPELHVAVEAALHSMGLESEALTNPFDLGPSRRKLLTLAAVIAMGTPVVVLDEPTTGQDLRGVARIEGLVDQLAAEGRTVIAISHDMRFVAEHFDRIVVLEAGRVVVDGEPAVAFAADRWPTLRSTWLEPPLAAVVGARLGLESTPTDERLVAALVARGPRSRPGSGGVSSEPDERG